MCDSDIFVYLDSINLATVAHIKRVYHKHKYDGFEDSLAGVPEYEGYHHYLRAYVEQELAGRDLKNHEADDHDDQAYDHVHHVVELVHSCFRVVECEGERPSLYERVHLIKDTKIKS